jgi:glycosyltransferase involved in cell wall biosynthesis
VLKKMAAAKITIVPSRAESFGLVNIESLSVGTPVVAARVGGIPDLIRDGVDGFLFSPESYQELAEKLHLLLSEPTRLAEMSRNARERFLSCYEEQRNIGKMSDWFESIPTQPAIRQEPSKA